MLHAFELHAIVAELGRRIEALRAEVRQLRGQASDAQAELVQAAHDAFGDRVFTSVELLGRALRDDGPGARLAELLGGRSVRSVGRLLAGTAGRVISARLILRSTGTARGGVMWHISTFT